MNPGELYKLLLDNWKDGNLTLRATTLGDTPAAQLLHAQFAEGNLPLVRVSQPQKTPDEKKVFIDAATFGVEFLGMKQLTGRIDFLFEEGRPLRLVISTTGESTFRMCDAFKSLAPYDWSATVWNRPAFTFDSDLLTDTRCRKLQERYGQGLPDPEREKKIIRGLSFSGELSFGEDWKWLADLVGSKPSIRFGGPLERLAQQPRFYFSSERHTPVAIGHLKPSFALDYLGLLSEFAAGEGELLFTNYYYSLDGRLDYKINDQPVTLPVRTLWAGAQPQQLLFTIETEQTWTTALTQLCGLFNVTSFTEQLPDPALLPVNTIVLKTISFVIGIRNGIRLEMVGADMGLPGEKPLVLFPELIDIDRFDLQLRLYPSMGINGFQLTVSADTTLRYGVAKGSIRTQLSLPDMAYSLSLVPGASLDLGAFVRELLPAFSTTPLYCEEFSISGGLLQKKFSLATQFATDFSLSALFLQITNVGLYFDCQVNSSGKREISAGLNGVLVIAKRFIVAMSAEVIEGAWTFGGAVQTNKALKLNELLPAELQLPEEFLTLELTSVAATVSTSGPKITFDTKFDGALNLGVARLTCSGFKIQFWKEGDTYNWDISATGAGFTAGEIEREGKMGPLLDIKGTFRIKKSGPGFQMSFDADADSGWVKGIPLLIPAAIKDEKIIWSEFDFRASQVMLARDNNKAWSFTSTFELKITRTWSKLQQWLSNKPVNVKLTISSALVSIELVGDLLRIEIPELKTPTGSGLPEINLGRSLLAVSALTLSLEHKKQFRISTELRYFLPQHLNRMFGTDAGGKPLLTIFRTYQPAQHDQLTLKAAPEEYLGVKFFAQFDGNFKVGGLLSSVPAVMLSTASDPGYWAIELGKRNNNGEGELGSIWIKKGEFSFDSKKGGFVIDAGWKVNRDPRIPLRLLKDLLRNSKVPQLADKLPASIPIPITDPPKFVYTDSYGKVHLNVAPLKAFLLKYFGLKLPEVIEKAIDSINNFFTEKLPDDFVEYLEFIAPPLDDMKFRLTVTATGSVDLSLRTGKPLRILLPGGPGLLGVTIREIAFGQMFGGSLLKVYLDAKFDTFHMINLAAAALSYIEPIRPYLGDLKKFRNRIYLEETTIVMFTQFPVPLPLFYQKIGVEYRGIGDFEFQSTFSLPAMELDLARGGEFLVNLVKFFTDKQFEMPVKDYKPMDLKFAIGPNFLHTGQWLGSKTIGLPQGYSPPSVAEALSWMLNTIKFFDLEAFIALIPVKDRMKSNVDVISNFLGMNVKGSWLITTPKEFITEKVYEKWEPSRSDSALFMRILPGAVEPKSKGLIFFISGDWNTDIGNISAAFGLVALNTAQFGTGFRFAGKLGDFFSTASEAVAVIQPKAESPLVFEGSSRTRFQVAGVTFFEGAVQVAGNKNEFGFSGTLRLNQVNESLQLWAAEAKLAGVLRSNYFHIEGSGSGRLLIYEGTAFVVAHYEKGNLRSKLDLSTSVGDFSFVLEPAPNGFKTTAWLSIKGGLLNLLTITELYQVENEKWIKFTLQADPAGGLMRLTAGLRLHFGSAIGIGGNFNLSMLSGKIPLFTGDCFYQLNYLRLNGETSILNVLKGTIGGSFRQDGFTITGSVEISIAGVSLSESSITISESGVSIQTRLGGLPSVTCSLRVRNNSEIVLCGPTFWINFTTGKFDLLHGCGNEQDMVMPRTYPMAADVAGRGAAHHLMLRYYRNKKAVTETNNRYRIRAYIVEQGKIPVTSVTATRLGARNDFFTELLTALQRSLPGFRKETLNIEGASIESRIDKLRRETLTLNFPKAKEPRLRRIVVPMRYVETSDHLMPMLIEGIRAAIEQMKEKANRPAPKKQPAKKKKTTAKKKPKAPVTKKKPKVPATKQAAKKRGRKKAAPRKKITPKKKDSPRRVKAPVKRKPPSKKKRK